MLNPAKPLLLLSFADFKFSGTTLAALASLWINAGPMMPDFKTLNETRVKEMFLKRAQEVLRRDLSKISMKDTFASQEMSSVEVMEIVGSMEDDLNVELPDSDLALIQSPKELVQLFLDQEDHPRQTLSD